MFAYGKLDVLATGEGNRKSAIDNSSTALRSPSLYTREAYFRNQRINRRGTFATAASGGKREQKGVAAVAEDEHIKYAKADAITAKGTAPRTSAMFAYGKLDALATGEGNRKSPTHLKSAHQF